MITEKDIETEVNNLVKADENISADPKDVADFAKQAHKLVTDALTRMRVSPDFISSVTVVPDPKSEKDVPVNLIFS